MTPTVLFTLSAAAFSGVALVVLAERLSVPSIALLLLGGVALGPEGVGLVQPEVLGHGLELVIALAVAVILFEGGLTLDLGGYRRAPAVIRRMLTIGVVITWLGTTFAVWVTLGLPFWLALLGGSLVIVTGPTVVSPLLRRIGVRDRIHHVLYWEAVLVDAIGVFVSVLCYEWITSSEGVEGPVRDFLLRMVLGAGAGLVGGLLLAWALRRDLVARTHSNIFVLTFAVFLFGACDWVLPESGILAVIVAGLTLGVMRAPQLRRLKRFKLELTELGIATLFVLLSARLDLDRFVALGWRLPVLLVVVSLVLRPINVWVSTVGQRFSVRERLFLSWIGPRGIVAASMASLFAIRLEGMGYAQASVVETFTFAVIGATVLIQGLSAPWVARALGVEKPPRTAWMLSGEPQLIVPLAERLAEAGASAVVVDQRIEDRPREGGYWAIQADPASRELADDPRLLEVSDVLAVSAGTTTNREICTMWSEVVGPKHAFRTAAAPSDETTPAADGEPADGTVVWNGLPAPSELARSLGAELSLKVVTARGEQDQGRFHDGFAPLMAVVDGRATLVQEPSRHEPADGEAVVVLARRIPGLADLVRDALIVSEPDSDLYRVVRALLELAGQHDPDLPTDELLDGILERERSMSTAMGLGVIIPHTYHPGVEEAQCVVANVPAGLRPEPGGGEPIQLVFLVLSPVRQAEAHLQALAAIARLVSDSDYRALLGRQRSARRLLDLIHERA